MVFPSEIPPQPPTTFSHRVAVANIATPCFLIGHPDPFVLSIMNDGARKAGRIEFGAIGGGALITQAGCEELRTIAPTAFEVHDDGVQLDARMTFQVPSEDQIPQILNAFLRAVLEWARDSDSRKIELDITREFIEELVDDDPAILSMAQLASIRTRLIGWKYGTIRQSNRGGLRVLTTPMYLCHEVVFEDEGVLNALLRDPFGRVKRVSLEELATTNGGRCEGRTKDGHVLFTNLFEPGYIRLL